MMNGRLFLIANLLLLCAPGACLAQAYQHNVSQSWDFTTGSTTQGWSPIANVPQFGVQNGTLVVTATATTYIIYSPAITVATAPMQLVEVVMSSNTVGPAKVFWAPSPSAADPNVGFTGFQGGDENDFTMVGDNSLHHYYLPIATSSASTIYRLRMDIPPSAAVAIQSVDIANLIAPAAPGGSPSWQFTTNGNALGWIPYSGIADTNVESGLQLQTYANTTLLAPAALVTNQIEWFWLMGTVTQTSLQTPWIQFSYASTANNGAISTAYIPVIPDSAPHVYNSNVGGDSGWYSTVSQLSITVSENTTVNISAIGISSAPQGPPDLALDACGPVTTLIRAGAPFQISCRVSDRGAETIQGVSAGLTLPSDGSVTIVSSPAVISSLSNGYPQTLTWTLTGSQPETIQISIQAASANGGSAQSSTSMLVNPAVSAATAPYVPPPVPVSSGYDIGIFYFPGWSLDSHWDPIRDFPERTPVLGNYAEGDPRVLDWQIKWAVEHGINFFAVDWYWFEQGNAAPPGELPNNFLEAYFSSAYHAYIQYCISYADDASADAAASQSDFLEITQAWITEYFSRPGYYQINGTPVVFVTNPSQLDASLGGSAKAALAAARQIAQTAGFKGIYFIACTNGNPSQATQLAADGYDALSAYSYGSFAGTSDPDEAPYSSMVTGYEGLWASLTAASSVPYIISTGTNWDPRPDKAWQFGNGYMFVRTGATPAQYQTMLQAAKARIDGGQNPPILMVDAWNELGEGHWSEPTAGLGFGYLDAIRGVFVGNSPHTDVGPADVGLPLVETQPATPLLTFTSAADLDPWLVSPGSPYYDYSVNISNSQVTNNQWTFTSSGGAILSRMGFNLNAADYSAVAIRMSATAAAGVTFYWGAADEPGVSAIRWAQFQIQPGATQTYTLALTGQTGWRGIIDTLYFMISCPPNTNFAISSIEFLPASSTPSLVASKTQVQFAPTAGATTPPSQVVSLAIPNGAGIAWTAASNASWLSLASPSGTGSGNITAAVNPMGLPAGVHNASIAITATGAANSPLTIPASLWVIPSVPLLTIAKSHTGNFAQGQQGTYSVAVSNGAGGQATSGQVTVTENLPSGLTLVSMTGTGWSCVTNTCTRSDALQPGIGYLPITVTVNVAANATSPQVNSVSVSGGGSGGANATDSTTFTQTGVPAFFAGEDNLGGGVYYLAFPNGTLFGYYAFTGGGWIDHFDMGYDYVDAGSGTDVYLWDLSTGHWWYTGATEFPYLYDFTLNAWIYYYLAPNNPGHYTTNPRYFVNLTTNQIFTM